MERKDLIVGATYANRCHKMMKVRLIGFDLDNDPVVLPTQDCVEIPHLHTHEDVHRIGDPNIIVGSFSILLGVFLDIYDMVIEELVN